MNEWHVAKRRKERKSVNDGLVNRKLKFIFIVDIYNEGVDIPE